MELINLFFLVLIYRARGAFQNYLILVAILLNVLGFIYIESLCNKFKKDVAEMIENLKEGGEKHG